MVHASLFTGFGGFDHAADLMEWPTAFQCEIEAFPRAVLMHRFGALAFESLSAAEFANIIRQWRAWKPGQPKPPTVLYADIKQLDARAWRGIVGIISGGFPCQPFSLAGKGEGTADPRALWPQMCRVIRECGPPHVVGENVYGLLSSGRGLAFEAVCADLETEGYEVQPFLLPAASVGAPHHRNRFWFVAHARCELGDRWENSKPAGQHYRPDAGRQEAPSQHQRLCEAGPLADAYGGRGQTVSYLSGRESNASRGIAADAHGERQQQPGGAIGEVRGWTGNQGKAAGHANVSGLEVGQGQRSHNEPQQPAAIRAAWRLTEPPLCTANDGIPFGLGGLTGSDASRTQKTATRLQTYWRTNALKGAGNAIVPQVALQIFQAIEATCHA